jgi:hypothetical protein
MHPVNNTAASTGPYYGNSSAHHQHSHHPQFGSPQPHHEFASSAQQQQPYMSPPGGPYYNTQNAYPYYSTPREQTEPPSSPPRIKRDDASSNLSMTSTIEETSSVMMMDHPTSNLKKMVVTAVASNHQPNGTSSESITAEGRQEVISDGRAAENEFTSRVASPTREHLPPKKRKTMSKESVLLMEINKLKADLGKAELKIKVLQEENERLRNQHRDKRHHMSNACSSTRSQLPPLPFIPDLPSNSPSKGMFDHHRNHHGHHHAKKQHLHPSYQVPIPTRPDNDKDIVAPSLPSQIPQDVFIQSSHHQRRDAERTTAQPYHPYSEKYDRQQHDSILRNSSSNSSRGDWMIPSSNNGSSDTPKKISFALSFDANTHGSKDSSRGYRCVSNRGGKAGMSSRPPLASRWKTR